MKHYRDVIINARFGGLSRIALRSWSTVVVVMSALIQISCIFLLSFRGKMAETESATTFTYFLLSWTSLDYFSNF